MFLFLPLIPQDMDSTLDLLDQPFDMDSPLSSLSSNPSSKAAPAGAAACSSSASEMMTVLPMPSIVQQTTPLNKSLIGNSSEVSGSHHSTPGSRFVTQPRFSKISSPPKYREVAI